MIEILACFRLGPGEPGYCSPMGLRREGDSLVLRAYRGTFVEKLLKSDRELLVHVCRDPVLLYSTLYESHFLDLEGDERLARSCSLVVEAQANPARSLEEYDEYYVEPLRYLRILTKEPGLVARICRPENLLVEALVASTREMLVLGSTSEAAHVHCTLQRYLVETASRLGSGDLVAALQKISSSLLCGGRWCSE